jgi:hypothetical protein
MLQISGQEHSKGFVNAGADFHVVSFIHCAEEAMGDWNLHMLCILGGKVVWVVISKLLSTGILDSSETGDNLD